MLDGDASLSAVSLYKVSPSDHHIIRYGLMQSRKSKCCQNVCHTCVLTALSEGMSSAGHQTSNQL